MKRIWCLLLCIVLAVSLCACDDLNAIFHLPTPKSYADNTEEKLLVHFLDVGQGDAVLLESRGEFVLVDAGEAEYGSKIVDYIEERGARSLKYVIATHPHSDHIGGMKTVLECIDTENFITFETDQSTSRWLNTLKAVEEYDVNYIDAAAGSTYSFGESSFTILAPLGTGYEGYNNYSVVIKAQCGGIRFMLTGDAEKESESEMLRSGENLSADVLKCGHHGSSTSTSDSFLSAVSPAFAVISCGENNDYGHPHRETIQKLKAAHIKILRTDLLGTIVAVTDGEGLRFFSQNGSEIPASAQSPSEAYYVGNKNSHVFHVPDCGGVKTMNDQNKIIFRTRDEALKAGFTPCSQCYP